MGIFQYGIRQAAETENHMTSVERISEYGMLPSEDPTPPAMPKESWPETGALEFKGLCLRFAFVHPL